MRKGWTYSLFVWLMMLAVTYEATAQTTGACAPGQADAYLNVGNVRARILNNGPLFYRGEPHVYEVPKGSGSNAIFSTSIWIGARVNGQIHTAATRYGEWEFWPGPLDEFGNPPFDCALYDQLWEITRDDLVAYAQTGTPTANLRDWPWRLGAPVIDGDGDPANYDLDGGDRPALLGDQMLWRVMNDVGNVHQSTDSPPMGMEVHGSAFAFHHPGSYVDDATFYRFKLINKNRAPLVDTYFGLYADPDLGDFGDDYLGSDSTLHLGYVYNSDNLDESGEGYGPAPPALGYTFLRSAVADADGRDNNRDGAIDEPGERLGMTGFLFFPSGTCMFCEPLVAQDYYLYMQPRWKDGQRITLGGDFGRDFSDIPTNFSFPGDPTTGAFWSERNTDGQGTPSRPSDRRFATATGPFTMQPGAEQEILFAVVWARGTDHLDSVRKLKKATARLHEVADAILVPDVTSGLPEPEPAPPPVLGFAQNYPNPFSRTTTIRYSLPRSMYVRLSVYDVLGREVAVLVDRQQDGGVYAASFDAHGAAPGVYVARFQIDALRFTKTMMVLR